MYAISKVETFHSGNIVVVFFVRMANVFESQCQNILKTLNRIFCLYFKYFLFVLNKLAVCKSIPLFSQSVWPANYYYLYCYTPPRHYHCQCFFLRGRPHISKHSITLSKLQTWPQNYREIIMLISSGNLSFNMGIRSEPYPVVSSLSAFKFRIQFST